MDIWIVTVGEPLPKTASAERLYRSGVLAEKLAGRGHHVTWISSNFDHFAKKFHQFPNDEVRILENYRLLLLKGPAYFSNIGPRRIFNHLFLGYRYLRLLRTLQTPDLILCSYPTIELSWLSADYAARKKIPCLLDIRDLWPDIFIDFAPRLFRPIFAMAFFPFMLMKRRALRLAAGLVGVSKSYLSWGLSAAGRQQRETDRVIPLGYESKTAFDRNQENLRSARADIGIPPDAFVAVFAGSFGFSYDLETVVSAARLLKDAQSNIYFVLCGSGEKFEFIKRLSQDLPNVFLTGWLDGRALSSAIGSSDVGLAAYKKGAPQSLPNKLFEYFAAGLPVASSLQGEAAELIDTNQCGVLYQAENAKSLDTSLQALAANREHCRRYGANAHRLFESHFSSESVFGEYVKFLEGFSNGDAPQLPKTA